MLMKQLLLVFLFLVLVGTVDAQSVKLLIVTGGHEYDSLEFFQMFDQMKGVEYEHFIQPEANRNIANGKADDFDLLVFYDMWQQISDSEKQAYLNLTLKGKPMLFLHHSIVSYQNWPQFEQIVGGRYVLEAPGVDEEDISSYEHDVWEYCSVENYTPVTAGFRELRFFDEIYENVRISVDVVPLLRIRHPKSMEYLAWENRFQNSKILYIQPGHDKRTFLEADYQKLLFQAIKYLTQK